MYSAQKFMFWGSLAAGIVLSLSSPPSFALRNEQVFDNRNLTTGLEENLGFQENIATPVSIGLGETDLVFPAREWVERFGRFEFKTSSPRYRTVSGRITEPVFLLGPYEGEYKTEIIADEEWRRAFPELEKLQDQGVGDPYHELHPGPWAFGQIYWAIYHFTKGPRNGLRFMMIREVQPGKLYRTLSHSQRKHLDRWKAEAVEKMAALAASRNLLIYATSPEVMESMWKRLQGNSYELETNYGRGTYPESQWALEPLEVQPDSALWSSAASVGVSHPRGRYQYYAYRGNAAIEQRLKTLAAASSKGIWTFEDSNVATAAIQNEVQGLFPQVDPLVFKRELGVLLQELIGPVHSGKSRLSAIPGVQYGIHRWTMQSWKGEPVLFLERWLRTDEAKVRDRFQSTPLWLQLQGPVGVRAYQWQRDRNRFLPFEIPPVNSNEEASAWLAEENRKGGLEESSPFGLGMDQDLLTDQLPGLKTGLEELNRAV